MNINACSERAIKSLIGLSKEKLEKLLPVFSESWSLMDQKNNLGKNPKQPSRKSSVSLEDKMMIVLVYLKTGMTFDAISSFFEISTTTCFRIIKYGLSVCEMTLTKLKSLPARDAQSTLDIFFALDGKKKIFIDATERKIRKPKYNQKKFYSGKNKNHTVKNQIICNSKRKILFLSETVERKRHDFKIYKEQKFAKFLPKIVTALSILVIKV